MDPNMYEAALDLGCKPFKALTKVIVPQVTPGIVTGGLLAFTMSIDDFIISYFTGGSAVNNLSIAVYGSARRGVSPSMYALSAIMFVVILVLLLIINRRSSLENV